VLIGLSVTNWRVTLIVVLPLLGGVAALGVILDGSVQPFVAGAGHGLMLGGVCRLVAWSLQRERAAAALGTMVGGYGGLILADLYGPRVFSWLGAVGQRWSFSTISLYAELLVAYLGAVAVAVLSKRVGPRR
jgi:hypothetical protein